MTSISPDSPFKETIYDVDNLNIVNIIESKVVVNSSTWTLYFDGSKSKEGAGAGCLLIDPKRNKHVYIVGLNLIVQTILWNMNL